MACQFETSPGGYERRFATDAGATATVYIVDAEAAGRERLLFALAREGFRASAFGDAAAFYKAFATARSDLVIVDIAHERERGLAIVATLRGHIATGVIVLSAVGAVEARVRSFDSGADAHLVKPVDSRELAAQLRALHRRLNSALRAPAPSVSNASWLLKQDGWILQDPSGRQMALTTGERAFVACLLAAQGRPASRDALLESLGGNPRDADPHRIDVLVNRLRRKAASLGLALPLHSVRGRGYAFATGTTVLPVADELARIAASAGAAPREIAAPVVRPLFTR
ncbi:MAG TPA: response regulator transcription factor [Rhodanobacteraceae bacterium]|jgi:DNA-binding response OmpR family regulator